ncbi:hypothetical protein D3C86_1851660 [compost metagenome]
MYEKSAAFEEDVKATYQEVKRHLMSKHPSMTQSDYALQVTSEAWRVFGNDNYRAKQIIDQQLRKDIANKDGVLYNRLLRDNEIYSDSEVEAIIKAANYSDETKRQQLIETIEFQRRHLKEED